jgi:hypothetical protein
MAYAAPTTDEERWKVLTARAKALGWEYRKWIGSHWTWVKVVNGHTNLYGGVLWFSEVEKPSEIVPKRRGRHG